MKDDEKATFAEINIVQAMLNSDRLFPIRRQDKKIADKKEIINILKSERVCRIGLVDKGMPYIVPVNFGYLNGSLYIHSSRIGRKIDILKRNKNVCFEIEKDVHIIPADKACNWDTHYTSVFGLGKAELLSDVDFIRKGLNIIMKQQSGKDDWGYEEKSFTNLLIIKINISSISGKHTKI